MKMRPLKINIFYCSNILDPQALQRCCSGEKDDLLKAISLPCSGKANLRYLLKAFETGADGVALVTCKQGECKYLEGNLRGIKRAQAVESLLEEIGFTGHRMRVISQTDAGVDQVLDDIKAFCDDLRKLP